MKSVLQASNTFRVPTARPLAPMRQRYDAGQPKKLSLIRPSSGYYGYNTKRTDSDTESAKFSSNNVSLTFYLLWQLNCIIHFVPLINRVYHRAARKVV